MAWLTRPPRVPPTVPQSWSDLLTGMTADDPAARPSARGGKDPARSTNDVAAHPDRRRGRVADPRTHQADDHRTDDAPAEPAPVRSRQRRGAAWLAAAGVLAAVLIIAALRGCSARRLELQPGPAGADRVSRTGSAASGSARPAKRGAALSRKLLAVVLTLVLAAWLQGCAPSGGR